MVIIDVHSHDFPDELAARAMSGMCRMTEGRVTAVGDGTLTNHLDSLDRAGVTAAVMCPIATKPTQFEVILRRACDIRDGVYGARAARKIIPFASVHPFDDRVLTHLDQIAAAGIRGVKFHPYYQDFSLSDRRCWPMFHRIAELGLVVQCHAGADASWPQLSTNCNPAEFAALLKAIPGLKMIVAHLGGCIGNAPHEVDRLLDCGAYIDTSVLHAMWFLDEPMRLLRSWPTERILFASDFPWVHYPEAIRWVKSIREPADWNALFGGNACRLLSYSPLS